MSKPIVINNVRKGTPWVVLATIALIIAKMGFGVQVAWLWVFAPIWIPLAVIVVLGVLTLIGAFVALGIAHTLGRK